MRFLTLLFSATLATLALADSDIAFTSVPASVVVGQSYNISWGGGDGTAVTITLRMGDPTNLTTVQILTTDAEGSSFTWTPSSSLLNEDDYALQITQGLNDINYSGEFSVSGGIDPISASISSILAASSSAAAASSSSAAAASANATMTSSSTTSGAAASMGTGTAIARNTTFSTASLASSTSGMASASGSSSSSAATSTTTSGVDGSLVNQASPIGLIFAILAALVYAV